MKAEGRTERGGNADRIYDALELATAALRQAGHTPADIANAMAEFGLAMGVKEQGLTPIARFCQFMALQLTALAEKEAREVRH